MNPSSELKERKTLLRIKLRAAIRGLSHRERMARSLILCRSILKTKEYLDASRLLIYVSTPFEIQTLELIRHSLLLKKEVYVPLIGKRAGQMTARRVQDPDKDLSTGAFGILEPASGLPSVRVSRLDYITVPGLGFDSTGGRIGRGDGYFDRFLSNAPHAYKVGLAFREQLKMKIPMEPHDVFMDAVITG